MGVQRSRVVTVPVAVAAIGSLVVGALLGSCTGSDRRAAAPPTSSAAPGGPCAELGGLAPHAPPPPAPAPDPTTPVRVLLFTRTEGFRHQSIDAATAWFEDRGADGLEVTATEEPDAFSRDGLADVDVVAFVNTTGDVLDDDQQEALHDWVVAGGGYVGVHAAADTEHDWGWYGDLVGAAFTSHPAGLQRVTVTTEAPDDPTVAHLPETWTVTDELYNYDRNPRHTSDVLLSIDEATATFDDGSPVGAGFTQGDDHPIAWSHQVGDGRSWYTGLGHAEATWDDPAFGEHLLGGIRWAAAPGRWRHDVITQDLEAPSALDVAPSGLVLWTERSGTLQVWDPATGLIHDAGQVPTLVEGEGGFIGVRLAPDAATTGHVFTYGTAPEPDQPAAPDPSEPAEPAAATGHNVLARYTLDERCRLDPSSRVEVLTVPNDYAGHQGGDLEFLADGTLLVGTGDDTENIDDGYAPLDDRPGYETRDARRTAANPDDLRGKILRIEPDGSIPAGNLFPDGDGGRPEIYAMGVRNPYRITSSPDGRRIWWGDIGPDARAPGGRGPQGYDELDTAAAPGDYGWPTCIADNQPYRDIDFTTLDVGPAFSCAGKEPAVLSYDYLGTVDPAIGSSVERSRYQGGDATLLARALMVGPYYVPDPDDPLGLPIGESVLLHEFGRNRIIAGTPEPDGRLSHLRRLAPWSPINTPVDVATAPDGSLYILETGQWNATTSGGARLTRLAYADDGAFAPLPATSRADGGRDPDAARSGAELYQLQCSTCHGTDGDGGRGPSLIDVADRLTLDEHLDVVRRGRGLMPAWETILTPEEIAAVVAYERTLRSED